MRRWRTMSCFARLPAVILLHESPKSLHLYCRVTLDLSELFIEIKENFSTRSISFKDITSFKLKKTASNHARTSLIRPPYFQFLQDPGCRNEFIVILANEQTVDWHSLLCHIWYQDFASFQPLRNFSPFIYYHLQSFTIINFHIQSFWIIYVHMLSYTVIHHHIASNTFIYIHILPFICI